MPASLNPFTAWRAPSIQRNRATEPIYPSSWFSTPSRSRNAAGRRRRVAVYLRDADARRLDRDPCLDTLWRLDTGEAAPTLMVEVTNHSPEPDGAYRHFWLRVDPELRPILDDGGLGPPQKATARTAVASTFGLSGADYAPDVET
jgi:hypothetical protein